MATAVIVYRSRTGTTRRFAEEIGAHLASRGILTAVTSVGDCDMATLGEADFLFLGCWTSGLMVIRQRPDEPWIAFARELARIRPVAAAETVPASRPRVVLFTTYKLATGGMFRQMRHHLAGSVGDVSLELKSRDGHLTDSGRRALDAVLGSAPT